MALLLFHAILLIAVLLVAAFAKEPRAWAMRKAGPIDVQLRGQGAEEVSRSREGFLTLENALSISGLGNR